VRGHLITAATLTATMAYQAILSPPGGFWQDSSKGNQTMSLHQGDVWKTTVEMPHHAGVAILDDILDSIPQITLYYFNITGINGSTPNLDSIPWIVVHYYAGLEWFPRRQHVFNVTMKYLLGITIVKDDANVMNQNGSTAIDFVEHCPNRDLKTMEILEFLFQAGVRRPSCGGSNPKPESLPDNPPPPPSDWKRKAEEVLQRIYLFWVKYFKVNHTWLQQVLSDGSHTL
ncbi:hypothetical protein C3L33_16271, partial [Rhododendron williamsianum]